MCTVCWNFDVVVGNLSRLCSSLCVSVWTTLHFPKLQTPCFFYLRPLWAVTGIRQLQLKKTKKSWNKIWKLYSSTIASKNIKSRMKKLISLVESIKAVKGSVYVGTTGQLQTVVSQWGERRPVKRPVKSVSSMWVWMMKVKKDFHQEKPWDTCKANQS